MFVEVQLLLNDTKSVLTVPDTAISYNPYGDSVFVIRPDKQGLKVQLKQIVAGETRDGRVEIVKGLKTSALSVLDKSNYKTAWRSLWTKSLPPVSGRLFSEIH